MIKPELGLLLVECLGYVASGAIAAFVVYQCAVLVGLA